MPEPHDEKLNWLFNDEGERDKKKIGLLLQTIGKQLEDEGQIQLEEGMEPIEPPSTPHFVLRHERMPEGELKVLMEMEWSSTNKRTKDTDKSGIWEDLPTGVDSED